MRNAILPACLLPLCLTIFFSCKEAPAYRPVIGFADAFVDPAIQQARDGFYDALAAEGFDEARGELTIDYVNADGDRQVLTDLIRGFVAAEVDLLATCPTAATEIALAETRSIPIFMMVAPTPAGLGVLDGQGQPPANLFGTGETTDYIDTSFLVVAQILADRTPLSVALFYDSTESQSVAAKVKIQSLAASAGIELRTWAVGSAAEVEAALLTPAFLACDAFFANPDDVVFRYFDTILAATDQAGMPVFTSEIGLVGRGAVCAYGADLYQWGYQTGRQAARFLRQGGPDGLAWELVQVRKRVYNPAAALRFNLTFPPGFEPIP